MISLQVKWKDDHGNAIVSLDPQCPAWVREAVRLAHNGELPNYDTCGRCKELAGALVDVVMDAPLEEREEAISEQASCVCDTGIDDLTAWLEGHPYRMRWQRQALRKNLKSDVATLMEAQALQAEFILRTFIKAIEEINHGH